MRRLCLVAGAALFAAPAAAQTGDGTRLDFGGYSRSLIAAQDLGYASPVADRRSVFLGAVVRLKWLLEVGDRVRVTVHNRIQGTWSSTPRTFGTGAAGFGVSTVPPRSVDLETTLWEGERYRVWHDLDRLAVTVTTPIVDVTVGRQAVTWGTATIFPVADLWTQFSPFELDTEEKRGIDAIRGLAYPAPGVELDMVVADRGTRRDLSAGIRATATRTWGDLYLAGGKFWREAIGLAGVSIVLDRWKLRGEVAVPYDLDEDAGRTVRATLGADLLSATAQLSIEYHYNGLGTTDAGGYLARVTSPELARGETYYLGRHYLGVVVSYLPGNNRLTVSASTLINLQDPSAALFPAVSYDLGRHTRLGAGALIALGSAPVITDTSASLPSEFGAYGRLIYASAAVYW